MTSFIDTADYQYLYSTVKIDAVTASNEFVTGTGFYFNFADLKDRDLIGIVTNRHVFENVVEATIKIVMLDDKGASHDQKPLSKIIKDLDKKVIYHPDSKVDLCAIPLALIIDQNKDIPKGWQLCLYAYSKADFPTKKEFDELIAIEDIIMIGYPDGLMDEINNKPIIKKGITSTHIKLDYENEKVFLIDMYCFGGSSGSPVLLYKYGVFEHEDGETYIGRRTRLLGVLYAGHDTPIEGELVKTPIKNIHTPSINVNMHIGFVLKAGRLPELGDEIIKNSA
jgi:hypothetical protein